MTIFRRGPHKWGVECRWGARRRSTVQFTAQTATHQLILCIRACSMNDHDEKKRTEQKLIVRSGKSEEHITKNRRLRSTFCTT